MRWEKRMKEEKQRKFQDALLKMLYPPPPSPPSSQEEDFNEALSSAPDTDEASASASSNDDCAGEISDADDQKLTRAQRKRLRKSKLKQAGSQRRKIIGPLLPDSNEDEIDRNRGEGVRQNAATSVLGEASSWSKRNKLKKRRKSKKLGVAKLNSSRTEGGDIQQLD